MSAGWYCDSLSCVYALGFGRSGLEPAWLLGSFVCALCDVWCGWKGIDDVVCLLEGMGGVGVREFFFPVVSPFFWCGWKGIVYW